MLCDGPCRRAFHEKCCTPNLVSAELDEEADWLCPACYAKVTIPPADTKGLSEDERSGFPDSFEADIYYFDLERPLRIAIPLPYSIFNEIDLALRE